MRSGSDHLKQSLLPAPDPAPAVQPQNPQKTSKFSVAFIFMNSAVFMYTIKNAFGKDAMN